MNEPEIFTDEQINIAIKQFLDYGEQTYVEEKKPDELGQMGYFSGSGWAARCLNFHLAQRTQTKP